jgi:hypothetical protein
VSTISGQPQGPPSSARFAFARSTGSCGTSPLQRASTLWGACSGHPYPAVGALFPLRPELSFEIVWWMSQSLESDTERTAVFNLGPMDGQEQPIEKETDELCVVMTDGQQHRYVRTEEVQRSRDGRLRVVFDWKGRYYGPK